MSQSPSASKSTPPGIERGRKYRFVVSSAEEAIETLRERLGAEAKVLSVKQVDGQGLSRFLKSPRLEIVATVPEQGALPELEPVEDETPQPAKAEQAKTAPKTAKTSPAKAAEKKSPAPALDDPLRAELESDLQNESDAPKPRKTRSYGEQSASRRRGPSDVWTVLRNAGFEETMLSSLRYDAGSDNIDELPLPRALAEVNRRLRKEYQALEQKPVTSRIAFFGTPGVGKTTALCKRLASDVFMRRQSVEVLKLDSDTPNPDDALSLFCDVLGVPLWRDNAEEELSEQADTLYVDLPGLPVSERRQWDKLRERLEALNVDTRVLVINGMYEASLISAAFDLGESMGATHIVVTHMDEMISAARLWPFILRSGLSPIFASHGQNVTSDYSEDILRAMLEKTFPSNLID